MPACCFHSRASPPPRLTTAESPVIGVNMADGFNWRTDAIGDHVHPNALGAEKMAAKWFTALTNVLAAPDTLPIRK